MKVGTRVRHKKYGWIGIIAGEIGKYGGIMVNLSDDNGIKFRKIHISDLEEIHECR